MSSDNTQKSQDVVTIREAAEDLVSLIDATPIDMASIPAVKAALDVTRTAIQAEQDRMFERMPGALWAAEGLKLMAEGKPVAREHIRAIAEAASWAIRTQDLFDERFAQDMMALNLWRHAHPDSGMVFPERTDLVKWLLDQVEASGSRSDERADELPDDVRRLVIAARIVTDAGADDPETRELFEAVEAFSSRVRYEDEPGDENPNDDFPESTNDKLVRTVEAARDILGVFTDEQRALIRDPGAAGLAMNPSGVVATAPNTRDLAMRFFGLPTSEKREIVEKLGVEVDRSQPSDFERYKHAIIEISKAGKLVELNEAITALDGPGTRHDRDKRREACERAIEKDRRAGKPMGSADIVPYLVEHAPGWTYQAHWREDGVVTIDLLDFDPSAPL